MIDVLTKTLTQQSNGVTDIDANFVLIYTQAVLSQDLVSSYAHLVDLHLI